MRLANLLPAFPFDPPDARAQLACVFLSLALRCRTRSTPPNSHPALLAELEEAGCTNLLDGIDVPLQLEGASEITDALRELAPEALAYLPARLYQAYLPALQRRHAGEFYTPRWLVELALERVGWPTASGTLTDPTCGAGAFLAGAALALRSHPPSEVEKRISGADINPLAVLGARVACLCAVADLLEPGQPFEPDIRVANLLDNTPASPSDLVVGNPPWIRFSDLSPDMRERTAELARHYDLVPKKAFHGGSELDLSAAFAYRMLDAHLKPGGRAALVLPSSLLRSPAASKFRRFTLPDATPLGLDYLIDFDASRVFAGAGATNRTALLCWTKGKPAHCVEAEVVRLAGRLPQDAPLSQARPKMQSQRRMATQFGKDRRIALLPPGHSAGSLDGASEARGRKGVTTDLNGAYFVRLLGPGSAPHLVRVANDVTTRGKPVPCRAFEVEADLLFPLLKGARQIRPFRIEDPTLAVILPNQRVSATIDEATFADRSPAAHAHFTWIEEQTGGALSKRSTYRRMLAHTRAPFFNVYNVGDYTSAPYKVVWAEIARSLTAGIAGSHTLAPLAEQVIVPDHKVYFAPFQDLASAQFLCALLNSTPVRAFVDATTEKLQVGALLDRVRLPSFDARDESHERLRALAEEGTGGVDPSLQARLDEAASAVIFRATSS